MEPQPPAPPPETKKAIWALRGAVVGAVVASLIVFLGRMLGPLGDVVVFFNLAGLFFTPLLALILTIPRSSRSFGLGLLLACLVCWLVELSICGGAGAYHP